ncbi:MAG: hypothetical protein Q8N83_13320 [Ignavibacteria bacterium]|nr:hypothetical protein [Ignavibacteria bacterium]
MQTELNNLFEINDKNEGINILKSNFIKKVLFNKIFIITLSSLFVLLFILIFFEPFVDYHKGTVIPSNKIPLVNSIRDLSKYHPSNILDKSLDEITAIYGYRVAKLQAKEWDNTNFLIYVTLSMIKVPGRKTVRLEEFGKVGYMSWIYVFINSKKNAWLGVEVCSEGIIATGYKYCYSDHILNAPMVGWDVEPKELPKIKSDISLTSFHGRSVWIGWRKNPDGNPRNPFFIAYYANTGKEIEDYFSTDDFKIPEIDSCSGLPTFNFK